MHYLEIVSGKCLFIVKRWFLCGLELEVDVAVNIQSLRHVLNIMHGVRYEGGREGLWAIINGSLSTNRTILQLLQLGVSLHI